jgi:peptide/nickel transport system permease protein
LAIFAPAIASNQAFVFDDGTTRIYPWFSALFNAPEIADYVFNMALVGFLPWLLLCAATEVVGRRRGLSGRQRMAIMIGEFVLLLVVLCALFAFRSIRPANTHFSRNFSREELLSPETCHGLYPPIPFGSTEIDLDAAFEPPFFRKSSERWTEANDGFVHLLGTDNTGRDVLTLLLYGTRISMTVGFVAVGIYVTVGVLLGALAGYFGGWVDMLISRVIEIILLFPSFFLILTLVALIGPNIYIIMVVIGITGWPSIARLIRGEVLKQRAIDYTMAAQALGSSHMRIVLRHILPNSLSPALVAAPFGIAGAIITEAGLSLLGFGVRPPTPTWGTLLRLGNGNYNYWWLIVVPSVAIFITVTVFNLVGNGLRDAMDPKLRI